MSLLERMSGAAGSSVLIQCHDNPDADTIASGFALYSYLKSRGKQPRLVYGGRSRIDPKDSPNLALLISACGIPLEYVQEAEKEPAAGLLVTVDCHSGEGNVAALKGDTVAVIDHHSVIIPKKKVPVEMTLSRFRSYDSCAAILWELLREEGYQPDKKLATALYYALYMDTNCFKRLRHPVDQRMMRDLGKQKIDREIFDELKACNFTEDQIVIFGAALSDLKVDPDHRFALVRAPECNPNLLGAISDQMMEVRSVDVCLVYSQLGGQGIKLSARSYKPEILTNRLVEQIALGLGSGGGTEDKAGGFLTMEKVLDCLPRDGGGTAEDKIRELLGKRLADCLTQGKATEERPWTGPGEGESIQELHRKAEGGDVAAQYHLGLCYAGGKGVRRDPKEAFAWYKKAAERDLWAELAQKDLEHRGERDPEKKQAWEEEKKRALREWAAAQKSLGVCYARHLGTPRDEAEAARWYKEAAENGDDHGQLNLARYYFQGKGVERSLELAAEWFHKAAGQGYAWAQKELADCYAGKKEGGFAQDWELAVYWYEIAANKGNPEAAVELAGCYAEGKGDLPQDPALAVYWYEIAANKGNPEAAVELAGCYAEGKGDLPQDPALAAYWYEQAARRGNPLAMEKLAQCDEQGLGVPKDLEKAARWREKLAESRAKKSGSR